MTRDDVQRWLDRYIDAWRSNDRAAIEALFTEDAAYRYRPYGGDEHAAIGRDAIVEAWLDEGDPPGSWDARYEPWALTASGPWRPAAATTSPPTRQRRGHSTTPSC
jgi:hypothetical protein